MSRHWTSEDDTFTSAVVIDFMTEVEEAMEARNVSQKDLAVKLGLSESRISQMLNTPGNLTIRSAVDVARALDLKISLVAYTLDDNADNIGPVPPFVFTKCWEALGKPVSGWELEEATSVAQKAMARRVATANGPNWVVDEKPKSMGQNWGAACSNPTCDTDPVAQVA